MDEGGKQKGSWWQTVPGILTATAGTITAVTGLIVALHQTGWFGGGNKQSSQSTVEALSEPTPRIPKLSQGPLPKDKETVDVPPALPKLEPLAGILFQDDFERAQLGEMYESLNIDPARLTMRDGRLLIVAGPGDQRKVPRNLILLQRKFPEDFRATLRLTMQVTQGNVVGLWYWVDSRNKLILGIYGRKRSFGPKSAGRHIGFTKYLNDDPNHIWQFYSDRRSLGLGWLGERQLQGYATKPEVWHLQLERRGVNYTGRVSIDSVEWQEVGTHTILNKDGRVGFTAISGEKGVENPAEFHDFVVKGIE